MNLTIRTHHATVADGFEEQAEEKLGRLQRWLPRLEDVTVELTYEETRAAAHRYAVQITARSGPAILRAEERAGDAQLALDAAADRLSRQARRHKTRLRDRHRAGAAKDAVADVVNAPPRPEEVEASDEEEYVLGNVVRVKHFTARPISQEEALAQMDLLGHDFFLFLDEATDDYELLYKRKDGDYGLLSPRRG
jgi:putative sigma-54 modulation protein